MTTIAFDGRYVAADSRLTRILTDCVDPICGKCGTDASTIYEDRADKLLAGQGGTYQGERIIAAVAAGEHEHSKHFTKMAISTPGFENKIKSLKELVLHVVDSASSELHLFTDRSLYSIYFEGSYPYSITHTPYPLKSSSGTGSMAARVSMDKFGVSAMRAIQIASEMDAGTGGKITYIDVWKAAKRPDHAIEVQTYTPEA